MKQLTKAEEQIMQYLWELKEASVKEIRAQYQEPKPALNTVSTIVRILENKAFVSHRSKGRGYIYFPVIEKEDYTNSSIKKIMNGYFEGSFQSMVSFFVKENNINSKDLEAILERINKK